MSRQSLGPSAGIKGKPDVGQGWCHVCGRSAEVRTCAKCGTTAPFCDTHFNQRKICGVCRGQIPKAMEDLRGRIFETPQGDLESLLEEEAAQNPALIPRYEPEENPEVELGVGEEEELEDDEDEGCELLGEGGEDYGLDPEGDWSEQPLSHQDREEVPDLIVCEVQLDGRPILEVVTPPLPAWVCDPQLKGTADYWRASQVLGFLRQRREHMEALGNVFLRKQRGFLEATDPFEAERKMEPLTQDEAARELRIHASRVSRLVKGKLIKTPRFGTIPLETLFMRDGGRFPPPRVLAPEIRAVEAREPGRRLTATRLRIELEQARIIPRSTTRGEKEYAERQIRRARALTGSQGGPDRSAGRHQRAWGGKSYGQTRR